MPHAERQRYVIIHGHFYQPPREDPWTGHIERQPSAEPHHDWNVRINAECYAANAAARTLSPRGRIVDIINNYGFISFNFGPTLFGWMEKEDPETYRKVLTADRESQRRNDGHGNAIAQVYNHVILPLADERDRLTQIRWGLADFAARFGRAAEGIWLAETAVNTATIDSLIACGVGFIILSPTQAEAVRDEEGQWRDVSNNSIDTSEAWFIATERGRIGVFFYDMEVSKAVGFQHLLTDAGPFRDRLLAAMETSPPRRMVNIATDGESYGHHEPHADMCLARLITDNAEHGHFRLTNYGWYLAQFPPRFEVRLKGGTNQLGTAWSCSHGLGRWMDDCGCGREGDWHQRWRAPLREAFDYLRGEVLAVNERLTSGHTEDFWRARDAYVDLLLDSTPASLERFCAAHLLRPQDPTSRSITLNLLEAHKNLFFMYTSCAWFFSEISGLEAVQCMRYAARALQLMADHLGDEVEERFLEILARAPSNLSRFGDGYRVWKELVEPYCFDGARIVSQTALEALVGQTAERRPGALNEVDLIDLRHWVKAPGSVAAGTAVLRHRLLPGEQRYLCYVYRGGHLRIEAYVKRVDDPRVREYLDDLIEHLELAEIRSRLRDWFPRAYGIRDLRRDSKERLAKVLFHQSFKEMHALRSLKLDEHLALVEFYGRLRLGIPTVERANIEATLNNEIFCQLELLADEANPHAGFDFARVSRLLTAAQRTGLDINRRAVAELFALKIERKIDVVLASRSHEAVAEILELLAFTNRLELDGRPGTVNRVFTSLGTEVQPLLADPGRRPTKEELRFARDLIRIGEALQIRVEDLERLLERRTADDPGVAEQLSAGSSDLAASCHGR